MRTAEERRRHIRYRVGDSAIAVSSNNPGHIKDICAGGLAFLYLDFDDDHPESDFVDILDGENDFFMERIPCRTVSNHKIINESPFNTVRMVKRTVQFGKLTSAQKSKLEKYIIQHAVGHA
jgi:hypothetical protein